MNQNLINNTQEEEKSDTAYRKKWRQTYFWGLGIFIAIIVTGYLISLAIFTKQVGIISFIFSCLSVGMVALFIIKCARIVRADEIAVKLLLGRPIEKNITSGICWIMWPIEKIARYTRELMKFSFMARSIITSRGLIKGYTEPIEPADVNLKCTLFAQFDEEKLDQTIENSPGSNAQELGPFLIPYAIDAVRAISGRIPWRLINQERRYFSDWVLARLIGGKYHFIKDYKKDEPTEFATKIDSSGEEADIALEEWEKEDGLILEEKKQGVHIIPAEKLENKSPFVIIGLKNVSFALEDLSFTNKDLANSISAPEQARLDATAKITAAEATKQEKIKHGEGDADARSKMITAIAKAPELEAISAIKEIGKGPSNFIFPLPEAFMSKVAEVFAKKTKQILTEDMEDKK